MNQSKVLECLCLSSRPIDHATEQGSTFLEGTNVKRECCPFEEGLFQSEASSLENPRIDSSVGDNAAEVL